MIVFVVPDSPTSSVSSLLHAAALLSSQLQRGVDLPSALLQACGEAYALCQRSTANQKVDTHSDTTTSTKSHTRACVSEVLRSLTLFFFPLSSAGSGADREAVGGVGL